MKITTNTDDELLDYRIKRLESQADMMQKMIKHPVDGSDALFADYAALLTVSAFVGFNSDAFDDAFNSKPTGESVQRQFFKVDQRKMMDLLAFAHAKDVNILKSCQKYDIFSAYASAGFDVLCKKLDAENRDWTDSKTVNECAMIMSEWFLNTEDEGNSLDKELGL